MACEGFCKEAINSKIGLLSVPVNNLTSTELKEIYPYKFRVEQGYLCPIGYKHNPATEDKTKALIRAGGRFTICTRNPWKYN